MASRVAASCWWVVLGTVLSVSGCKKKSPVVDPPTLGDASVAESGIAEPGVVQGDGVTFRITKVYPNQRATDLPPFHADGGEKTYFDAKTRGGASFTFGFAEPKKGSSDPPSFGDVTLSVPSSSDAQSFVSEMARRFHGKEPPVHLATKLRPPKGFSAAFLATDAQRSREGFSGSGGGYYATKLFLQRRGLEAEVFFNFNLKTQRGEFAEKDSDYANDMVAFFASELRDEPPPPRDPGTDPRVSRTGPTITWGRELNGSADDITWDGERLLVKRRTGDDGAKLVSISLDTEGDEQDVLFVPHALSGWDCRASTCLAVDFKPNDPRIAGSSEEQTVIVVDRTKKTQREVKGRPWGKVNIFTALSTDGRFVAIDFWGPKGKVLYLAGMDGGLRGPIDVGASHFEIEAFAPTKLTLVLGDPLDKKVEKSIVDVDLKTLAVSPARPKPATPAGELSPDRTLRVSCSEQGERITVTSADGGSPRTFDVFDEDQRELKSDCVSWAGSRFLSYPHGFIDVMTMKFSRAFAADDEPGVVKYDRAFKHVVRYVTKLQVGTITVPPSAAPAASEIGRAINALSGSHPHEVEEAIAFLVDRRAEAVPALIAALEGPSAVRAASLLGRMRAVEAVPALTRATHDGGAGLQWQANQALDQIRQSRDAGH